MSKLSMKRFSKRAQSDPWICDRMKKYFFCRRFTVGGNNALIAPTSVIFIILLLILLSYFLKNILPYSIFKLFKYLYFPYIKNLYLYDPDMIVQTFNLLIAGNKNKENSSGIKKIYVS